MPGHVLRARLVVTDLIPMVPQWGSVLFLKVLFFW